MEKKKTDHRARSQSRQQPKIWGGGKTQGGGGTRKKIVGVKWGGKKNKSSRVKQSERKQFRGARSKGGNRKLLREKFLFIYFGGEPQKHKTLKSGGVERKLETGGRNTSEPREYGVDMGVKKAGTERKNQKRGNVKKKTVCKGEKGKKG